MMGSEVPLVWIPSLSLPGYMTLGVLVNTPEPQSSPPQNEFVDRLGQINVGKAFRTVPGYKMSTPETALVLLAMGQPIGHTTFSI